MNAEEIGECLIGAVEIHAGGIGSQQSGWCGRDLFWLRGGRLSHDHPLRFRLAVILR
ncbi:hypothetical protein ACVWXL_008554 [Bradyrhizobium sp. GM22.5]